VNLAPAAEAPFGNEDAFTVFLGDHEIAHEAITLALGRAGRQVPVIPLADTPIDNNDWMMDHWQIHLGIGSETGIPVPDLVGYDLRNEVQYEDWMTIHSQLHSKINEVLGIRS
jgi:hypothetical protein